LLTVLLFYFGRVHTQAMFRYLRVPFTVLDIAPEDYLVRSADGLFVPASVVATVTVLLCWGRYLVVGTFSARAQFVVVRVTTPLVLLGGIGLVGYAVVAIVLGDAAFPGFPEGGGLALASGVLLLACAVRLVRGTVRRRRPNGAEQEPPGAVIEWGAIFVVVGVGLFWAINSYAVGVGTSRGEQISEELGSSPDVVLYSEKSLSLQVPGVREVRCQDPDAAYRFRYEGLKFVLQSGDQYLFMPSGWRRTDGAALLIPRTDALRLEFAGPGQTSPTASC
jgi:hypothetical protein